MLKLPGFKPRSLAFGVKYVKSFMIYDVRGVIADYVLGECGAPGSPIPADFFSRVKTADNAVALVDDEETREFTVSRDKVVYAERQGTLSTAFDAPELEIVRSRAMDLMTGALRFLKDPNLLHFGIVWDYARTTTQEHQRYKHPAAAYLAERMLKMEFKANEYPAEVNTRVTFRRRLTDGVMQTNVDDYINAILNVRDERMETLWNQDKKPPADLHREPPRTTAISIDVQHIFDPVRPLNKKMFETHWTYCEKSIAPRLSSLLRELDSGTKA